MATYPPLCDFCGERFALEGQRTCFGCSIHDEDDSRYCGACGSALGLDGACLCDLGDARAPDTWKGKSHR